MAELAKRDGLSLEELLSAGKSRRKRRAPNTKYQHPEDASLKWSGRGKQPAWVRECLERGMRLEDLKA
jgi:DNA-binding protein H-NS